MMMKEYEKKRRDTRGTVETLQCTIMVVSIEIADNIRQSTGESRESKCDGAVRKRDGDGEDKLK
jgi:hypothetical protein